MEDKLDDIEREALRKLSGRYINRGLWVAGASTGMWIAAIWLTDWRFAAIGVVLFCVAAAVYAVGMQIANPKHEAKWAYALRGPARAKKAREDRERKKREDLEREFGMRD